MERVQSASGMRRRADALRCGGRRLVLVPTMGGLHRGHLALIRAAQKQGDHVTVSIFVNPTQFAPGEDYADYPTDLDRDCMLLEETGAVDTVFAPTVDELYPTGAARQAMWVQSELLTRHLCGPHRQGHFRGVLTVVTKLFSCCRPHVALFGLKDAQQYILLKRLVAELLLDVVILGHETVREPDGLALSSRNAYLSRTDRAQAVVLSRSVTAARRAILNGERRATVIEALMQRIIRQAPSARLEYAEVVSTADLQPLEALLPGTEVLAAVAARFGKARLIDNQFVTVPAARA